MAVGQALGRGLRWLVLAAASSALLVGVKLLAFDHDAGAGVVILLGSAAAFGMALYLKAVQEADPFLAWLAEHAHEVKAGTALYEGSAVRAEDEIVRFQACTSVIVLSFRYSSPWQLSGLHPVLGTGLLYGLVTLASGWWGLHGIWWSLQALWGNLRGGTRLKIAELLEPPPPPDVRPS